MGRYILGVACFLATIPAATAQVQITYTTYAIGCQRITEIAQVEVLAAPTKVGADVKGTGTSKIETLSAKDWNNGVQFTDGGGRLWRLAYGPVLKQNPPQLNGTLTNSGDGRVLFLTNDGTLFIRVEK